MTEELLNIRSPGPRHPPQITVSLDDGAHVLNVNRGRAGTRFDRVVEDRERSLHEQMHPGCDGDCRFNDLWKRAWSTLGSRDSVEWEVDDEQCGGWLRLNLSRPPTSKDIKVDRRKRYALLTITDISRFRKEYEALMSRYESLLELVHDSGTIIPECASGSMPVGQRASKRDESENTITARTLAEQVIDAQESECRRIAADLHDGIAQTLGVMKFGIEGRLVAMKRKHPDVDLDCFGEIVDQLKTAIDDVRRISRNLAPSVLDDFGVIVAVESLCREFQAEHPALKLEFSGRINESILPDVCKIAAYRVIQEALNNIAKHSGATSIKVLLRSDANGIFLEVTDDGAGFDLAAARHFGHGFGMRSMRERVEPTGGHFDIESKPGKGTTVRARWSIDALRLLAD